MIDEVWKAGIVRGIQRLLVTRRSWVQGNAHGAPFAGMTEFVSTLSTPNVFAMTQHMDAQPCVYILASKRNGTLYTGVTKFPIQRIWQHRGPGQRLHEKIRRASPGLCRTARHDAGGDPARKANQGMETSLEDRVDRTDEPDLARSLRGHLAVVLGGLAHLVIPAQAGIQSNARSERLDTGLRAERLTVHPAQADPHARSDALDTAFAGMTEVAVRYGTTPVEGWRCSQPSRSSDGVSSAASG